MADVRAYITVLNDVENAEDRGGILPHYEVVPEIRRANCRLKRCETEEERIQMFVEIYKAWCEAERSAEAKQKAQKFFGNADVQYGERIMITLTADGRQLRIWTSLPAHLEPRHVDSCGAGNLMNVVGEPEVVIQYLKALRPRYREQEIVVPNGVRIYLSWSW